MSMREVRVHGALREYLGQSKFYFDISTPREAIAMLCCNFPGLRVWLGEHAMQGYTYMVRAGRLRLDESLIDFDHGDNSPIQITPILLGSGKVGKILLGVGLAVGGILTGGLTTVAGAGFFGYGGALAHAAVGLGASLTLGGIAGLLTPTPRTDNPQQTYETPQPVATMLPAARDPKRSSSYQISGVQNMTTQGAAMPLVYGRVICGSIVASAAVSSC